MRTTATGAVTIVIQPTSTNVNYRVRTREESNIILSNYAARPRRRITRIVAKLAEGGPDAAYWKAKARNG